MYIAYGNRSGGFVSVIDFDVQSYIDCRINYDVTVTGSNPVDAMLTCADALWHDSIPYCVNSDVLPVELEDDVRSDMQGVQ